MKKVTTIFASIMIVFIFSISTTLAQSGDTLVVYATTANLEEIINNDTTSTGLQAHKAYKLVSLDTTYVFQGPITVKSDITVIGVPGSDGRPPCIQPLTLPDNSLPNFLFVLNGPNTKAVFKNLYLTGKSTDNTINTTNYNGAGALIQLTAEGIRLTVDKVVFSDWPTNNIGYSADNCSIFVTNCVFRNATVSTAWYSGEAVRNTYNTASSDTIIMKNNTMFCMAYSALCPVTINPVNYLEFSHNSVIYTFKNPFWIYNLTNGKVNDNLFYAAFSGASSITEHFGLWDQLRSFERTGVVDFDTLNTAMAEWLDPGDIGQPDFMWLAEAKRNIEFKNNVCFWPKLITDFWAQWNVDHAGEDSVITPVWLNARTLGMFADHAHWPGLVSSGNLEVDPQFSSSINDVLYDNTGCGNGFFAHFTAVRTNNASTVTTYGYKIANVEGDNWIPEWPLPETEIMKYENASLKAGGTDGKPVGDPNWFGGASAVENTETLPASFALYDAYPNPFNPSTSVKFSLSKAGNVNLKIYNVMGQLVKTVVDNEFKATGSYEYKIGMDNYSSGVYLLTLSQGNQQSTKKIILLK